MAAVTAAAGSVYAGVQQKNAAEYNQALAEQQAEQERLEAEEAGRRQRTENEAFLASQRARRAKSGVSLEGGSSLLIAAESAKRLEMQVLETMRTGETKSQSLFIQADQFSKQGNVALTSGLFQAGSQLMSAGAAAAGSSSGGETGQFSGRTYPSGTSARIKSGTLPASASNPLGRV